MTTTYEPRLDDMTTEHLIDSQRILPIESVAAELERRGVVLAYYGLTRGANR